MEITLYAVGNYNMAANLDVTIIKVGAYPWSTINFSTPQVPAEPTRATGAAWLAIGAATSAFAMYLF